MTGEARVEVSLEMWPHWLNLGLRHWKDATSAHDRLLAAHFSKEEGDVGDALNSEFQAAMQSVAAAAFTLDALYGILSPRVPMPQATRDVWKARRTERWKRVAEVVRLAAVIPESKFPTLRDTIRRVFTLRDQAVHPDPTFREPVVHPELSAAVDARFTTFTAVNANSALACAIEAILDSFERSRLRGPGEPEWAQGQAAIAHQVLDENGVVTERRGQRVGQ